MAEVHAMENEFGRTRPLAVSDSFASHSNGHTVVATPQRDFDRPRFYKPAPEALSTLPTPHTIKHGKKKLRLFNPMSLLLRRRSAQSAGSGLQQLSNQPLTIPPMRLPDGYDPRIRGEGVHDFSAPRERPTIPRTNVRRPVQSSGTANDSAARPSSIGADGHDKPTHVSVSSVFYDLGRSEPDLRPVLPDEDFDAASLAARSPQHYPDEQAAGQAGTVDSSAEIADLQHDMIPPNDFLSGKEIPPTLSHTVSLRQMEISEYGINVSEQHRLESSNTSQRQGPNTGSVQRRAGSSVDLLVQHSALPKHLKSKASRFSFDLVGTESAAEESLLEEKHRKAATANNCQVLLAEQTDHEKVTEEYGSDDEDISALTGNDGAFIEEAVPGINVDVSSDEEDATGLSGSRPSPALTAASDSIYSSEDVNSSISGRISTQRDGESHPLSHVTHLDPTSKLDLRDFRFKTKADPFNVRRAADESSTSSLLSVNDENSMSSASVGCSSSDGSHYDEGVSEHPHEDVSQASHDLSMDHPKDNPSWSSSQDDGTMAISENGPQIAEARQDASDKKAIYPSDQGSHVNTLDDVAIGRGRQLYNLDTAFIKPTSLVPDPVNDLDPSLTLTGIIGDEAYSLAEPENNTEEQDFAMEDDQIIAAANAEVLASDAEGFYGQEFGFYADANGISDNEYTHGGFFGSMENGSLLRSHSGNAAFQEPNLTPITERSEYSTRSSFIFPHISATQPLPSLQTQGLAQLAATLDSSSEDDLSLASLQKLRRGAWGGSNRSLRSAESLGGQGDGGSPLRLPPSISGSGGHIASGLGISQASLSNIDDVASPVDEDSSDDDSIPTSPTLKPVDHLLLRTANEVKLVSADRFSFEGDPSTETTLSKFTEASSSAPGAPNSHQQEQYKTEGVRYVKEEAQETEQLASSGRARDSGR